MAAARMQPFRSASRVMEDDEVEEFRDVGMGSLALRDHNVVHLEPPTAPKLHQHGDQVHIVVFGKTRSPNNIEEIPNRPHFARHDLGLVAPKPLVDDDVRRTKRRI